MAKWMQVFAVAVVCGFGFQAGVSAADAKKDDKKPAAEEKKKDPKDMNADEANAAGLCPICKKDIKPVYHSDFKDKTYTFASRNCQKEFAANPEKYGAKGEVKADKKK
jgi:YHS domain-containing protein